MKSFGYVVAAAAALGAATAAQAGTVNVTPTNMQGWSSPLGETAVYGGTAAITGTAARSGDGSLELSGPRSRFVLGTLYPNTTSASFGLVSDMRSFTFDWMLATDSNPNYNPLYTPALRFTITNGVAGTAKKEMIWEGVYNNTYNTTTLGQWYTSGVDDKFYIGAGNENAGKSIASWATDSSLAGWYVTGISVGHGGGAGAFHAFADNLTVTGVNGSTTYNFDLTANAGAVPEPASWALMIVGVGAVGGAMRRRKSKVTTNVAFA